MNPLTSQDITNILAALEIWEKEPVEAAMKETMFSTLLGGIGSANEDREAAMGRIRTETERKMRAAELAKHARREEAILLQAKLITLRNEIQRTEFLTPETA